MNNKESTITAESENESLVPDSYEGLEIRTMNLCELEKLFRSLGMKVSQMTLGAAIMQGKYPFAIGIETDKGGRRFEVYTKLVHQWVAERVTLIDKENEGSCI